MAEKDLLQEFGSFQDLLAGCASRLSEEGFYFEVAEPRAIGSDVGFEVRIRDSFSVLRGEGQIVGATDEGVFVRLVYLDQPSLKLLPKLVEHYRRHGIPLVELPEIKRVEVVEPEESLVEEDLRAVDEPTADDLWPEEDTEGAAAPVGLTLDDLEAEFLAGSLPKVPTEEPRAGAGSESRSLLVDATAAAIPGMNGEVAEIEPEVEPVLIDPVELIADSPVGLEDFAPDDIHLEKPLLDEEDARESVEEERSIDVPGPQATAETVEVDSGLPWLPAPAERSSRGLWVLVLCIVLGAALGAAVYYFFLRPGEESSLRPAEPLEILARSEPAAQSVMEPLPTAADVIKGLPHAATEIAPGSQAPTRAVPAATRPQSPDPLTGVNRITWVDESDETVITFWGDGLFVAEQVDDFRVVGGAPREVVRIRGIRRPFSQQQIDLDTDHVRRIRVGLHQEANGVALHFVADLVDGDVELSRTEAAGEQLRVYFSKAG